MADNEQQLIKLPTDAEYQDEINRALEPLVGQIPSVDNFTVQSITECNLTVKDFCSACRGLASYATQGILEKLISAANVAGIVKSIYQFGSKDMFDVAQWVKTAAGKEIVVSITTTRKLERRAHPGSSASNMAWLSIFTQMQSEHSRLIKKEKNRCARKAAEYRQKIDLLEQASAERCAAINSNYPALNEFVDIPRTDMVNRCWQAYIFDCNTKGVPAKGKNQQNIVQAIQEFGHKVRELHAEEFCRRPEVQRALEAFAHQKIAGLSSERTPNDVETFRRYLAAATGRQVTVPAASTSTAAPATGANRQAVDDRDNPEVDAALDNVFGERSAEEEDVGNDSETSLDSQGGVKEGPRKSSRNKSKARYH
nr:putative coat protein [Aconitum amalgavirus 1]